MEDRELLEIVPAERRDKEMVPDASFIPPDLAEILSRTPGLERAYVVGGAVRDACLGWPCEDFDIEVFGVSFERLAAVLSRWGRTDMVGKSFGVLKLKTASGAVYDFSLPRRDAKIAAGHKGFQVVFDPGVTLKEAAARRDFTVNALMFDPGKKEVIDFFEGISDLERRVLRHTTDAFSEDPLRVLRGMQLAGRYNLAADLETIQLCRQIKSAYAELAPERVRDEWIKWAVKSTVPSAGLKFLEQTEWIEHYPELARLRQTPQDPEWHPEGDVFAHTCHCCDALVGLPEWRDAQPQTRLIYTLATLTHDLGKAQTTEEAWRDGRKRIISPRHDEAGAAIATEFLHRLYLPDQVIQRVVPLVAEHMVHLQHFTERSVRKLSKRLNPETIENLCVIIMADHMGRPPLPRTVPETVLELRAIAAELNVQASAPRPILTGGHLIELGMSPGRELGSVLHRAYEAQLEGQFATLSEAYHWLGREDSLNLPSQVRDALRSRCGTSLSEL